MECPTVRIKATSGSYPFTTINEADFDPAKHERYVEGDALAAAKAKEEADAKAKEEADAKAKEEAEAAKQAALDAASKLNKADLLAHLTSLEIEHDESMTKAELLALLA